MVKNNETNGGNLGFENKLWKVADKLRGNMDAAEYKHVVLGLIFLKYVSDTFEEKYKEVKENEENAEDRDYYLAENIFWVPKNARWSFLQANAKQPTIGKLIDEAMEAVEHENKDLVGVLPKDYSRPSLDKSRLGELIDLIGTIGLGDKESRSKDILGRVYEYFLGQFANAEGKKGGQFYTPRSIVRLLVDIIEPYKGRVFDPCCGSGGMFVQSERFIQAHSGRMDDIHIYGQESNQTTWRLCKMNLAIRQIDSSKVIWNSPGSFLNDAHKDLKADFILANPPFNDSDWSGEQLRNDVRWKYGVPPTGNANFAWVQHFIHHLAPTGIAGFVLANGSMSSDTAGEGNIRTHILEADLVDCIISLPDKLFYNVQIPACLWFIARDKRNNKFRNRSGEILFIETRNMGILIDRKHREFTNEEINKIASTYHSWRRLGGNYLDIKGFCRSVKINEVKANNYVLTPGRYIEAEVVEDDVEKFKEKMERLSSELTELLHKSKSIDQDINKTLGELGYGTK